MVLVHNAGGGGGAGGGGAGESGVGNRGGANGSKGGDGLQWTNGVWYGGGGRRNRYMGRMASDGGAGRVKVVDQEHGVHAAVTAGGSHTGGGGGACNNGSLSHISNNPTPGNTSWGNGGSGICVLAMPKSEYFLSTETATEANAVNGYVRQWYIYFNI